MQRAYWLLAICAVIFYASENRADGGAYGYYWAAGSFVGPNHNDVAMQDCNQFAESNPSCVGVSLQSSTETSAVYKRVLSNGQQSSAQIYVGRSSCNANTTSIASCQEGYVGTEDMCGDGFPPQTGDYQTCDRPNLKACDDGSYVVASNGVCPIEEDNVCWDRDSCYIFAYDSDSTCSSGQVDEFVYRDPQHFTISCSDIDSSSPDHPDNGGNSDGNPYNDPNTPTSGEGSTPPVSDTDPDSLSQSIDDALQDNFGDVERAVRDSIESNEEQAGQTRDAISDSSEDIVDALNNLTPDNSEVVTKLDEISGKLGDGANEMPPHTQIDSGLGTFSAVVGSFKQSLDSSPLVTSFSNVTSMFNTASASCPVFSVDLPSPISETVSTDLHCSLAEDISLVISSLMLVIYTWAGFRIVVNT